MKSWRLKVLTFFIFILAAIVISRLFYIQILNGKFYQAQALGQQAGFKEISGDRGQVFLSNSKETRGQFDSEQVKSLAINQDSWLLYTVPSQIEDKQEFSKIISQAIGETEDSVISKLDQSATYAIIKKNLSEEDIVNLKKLNLKDIYFENTSSRLYLH